MIAPLTQFGSSGLGALGLNLSSFIIQLITFIIALLVLRKWAFKPILRVMDERRETIEKGVKLGEEMQKEKDKLDQSVSKVLADARTQADGIIAEAGDVAKQNIKESEDKAKEKADQIIASARDSIAQDEARARKALEKEIVGLVSDATEAIIEEKIDAKKDAQLIEKALKGRGTA